MAEQTSDNFTARAVFLCPRELLDAIDRSAAASYSNRSDIIRAAVVDRLRKEGVIPFPHVSMAGAA